MTAVLALAITAALAGFYFYQQSWTAYERRWRTAVDFAPKINLLLEVDPLYKSVISSPYQIGGPAEILVTGTLESQAQLDKLKNQISAIDPPIPIVYDIVVTDLLRQGRQLAADLGSQGLEPSHWVINPATNGTFALVYRDRHIESLKPLADKPIYALKLYDSIVTDLTPLETLPLDSLVFEPDTVEKGLDTLRNMTTLKRINGLPVHEFWKQKQAEQSPEPY